MERSSKAAAALLSSLASNEKKSPTKTIWRRSGGKCHHLMTAQSCTNLWNCIKIVSFEPRRNKRITFFFHLHLAIRFPSSRLSATHFRAGWLSMIGARQPSGLNYWSLLTAAYPTQGRSKHDDSWPNESNISAERMNTEQKGKQLAVDWKKDN